MKLYEDIPKPVVVELKPNRLLLDPNFDGYRLSLDKPPCFKHTLHNGVDRVGPSDDQYSIQHSKLFAQYNGIHCDKFNPNCMYVVGLDWTISKIQFNPQAGKFLDIKVVWKLPVTSFHFSGRYNVSICFLSPELVMIADGAGTLYLVNTGDRSSTTCDWSVLFEKTFYKGDKQSCEDCFLIMDARMYSSNDEDFIDGLFCRLESACDPCVLEKLKKYDSYFLKTSSNHPFVTCLDWVTFAQNNGLWDVKNTRKLIGPCGTQYCYLEDDCKSFTIASENLFVFTDISDQELKYTSSNSMSTPLESRPDFVWMQNDTQVTVVFKLPKKILKRDLAVDIKSTSVSICFNGNILLEGELPHNIKADESVWTLSQSPVMVSTLRTDESCKTGYHCLEVVLQKCIPQRWQTLVVGNLCGDEISDPEVVSEIHKQLEHLCSDKWNEESVPRGSAVDPQQLEECDGLPADCNYLHKVDLDSQCISHSINLGGHQWLFVVPPNGINSPPTICLRHDVDGLLWKTQKIDQSDVLKSNWSLEHVATFSAIGYVQASKQQRKFTVAPTDFSYVAICDSSKHVYLYRQPNELSSDLRNRKTGRRVSHIAQQQVLSIDAPFEILGASASNEFLYILSSETIYAFRVNTLVED